MNTAVLTRPTTQRRQAIDPMTNDNTEEKTAPAAARRSASQARAAEAFAQIVTVLMRDPAYRSLTLADLEALVLPPLMAGQFRVAHASAQQGTEAPPPQALAYPVAVALWARVSAQVDARLAASPGQPARLTAAEWVSGEIPWLIVVAGHPRAVPAFLKQLKETEFQDKTLKMRTAWSTTPGAERGAAPGAAGAH